MFIVIVELVTSFIQYLGILVSTHEVEFPDSWKQPFNFMSAFNLHFDFIAGLFPSLGDLRLYFTVVSVVGPLCFVIFGLIFLNPKLVVIWYCVLLCGIMSFIAGAFGRIIVEVTDLPISAESAEYMMYGGAAVALTCAVIYAVVKKVKGDSVFTTKKDMLEKETEEIDRAALLQRLLLLGIFIAFFFTSTFWLSKIDEHNTTFRAFWTGLTWACLGFAVICLVWLIMGLFKKGREIQWQLGNWAEVAFLRILLIAMSLVYIPIGSGVFLVFNCNEFTCENGYRLPDLGSSIIRNHTDDGVGFQQCNSCIPADLTTQRCPSSVHNTMCALHTESRLEYDVANTCTAMQAFFWPAAAVIVIMFVLGAPVLFQQMISRGSVLLLEEFPLMYDLKKERREKAIKEGITPKDEEEPELTEQERWDKTLAQSDNVAKFLYQPFTRQYRYVRLVQLIQKLIIVAATVYVYRNGAFPPAYIAIIISLGIHLAATIALLWHKPFINGWESKVAILMSFALFVATSMGLLILTGVEVPDIVMLIIIILNGLLPLVALILGIVLEYSRGKQDEEEETKKKQAEMLKRVQHEEMQEVTALMAAAGQQVVRNEGTGQTFAVPVEQPPSPPQNSLDPNESSSGSTQPPGVVLEDHHVVSPPARSSPAPAPLVVTNGKTARVVSPQSSPQTSSIDPQTKYRQTFSPQPQQALLESTSNGHHTGILMPTKSQKRLRKQKKLEAAEKQIEEEIEADLVELREKQEDVDLRIDHDIKKVLNRALMGAGVLGFLALGLCVLGLMVSEGLPDPLSSSRSEESMFEEYRTFDNFTQHCCCIPHTNPEGSERQIIEKWVCENSKVVERIRMTNATATAGEEVSGLAVRGLCATTFNSGCSWNSNFALASSDNTSISRWGVTCLLSSVNVTTNELDLV